VVQLLRHHRAEVSPAPAPAADPEPERMQDAPSPIRKLMLPIGHFLFRFRNLLFPLLFLPLAAILEPAFMEGDTWIDDGLDALGVIVLPSVARWPAIKRAGKGSGRTPTCHGRVSPTRQPLYLGNIRSSMR
jgi:hypothetical protein